MRALNKRGKSIKRKWKHIRGEKNEKRKLKGPMKISFPLHPFYKAIMNQYLN